MQGILFKEPLYHKVEEGLKTQTRRIILPQPDSRGLRTSNVLFEDYHGNETKPRYNKGEVVYLKEPYVDDLSMDRIFYKFNPSDIEDLKHYANMRDEIKQPGFWKNKLFMPKKYARTFIKVTDDRVERVADISEEDAIAEGVEQLFNGPHGAWIDYYPQEIDYNLGSKKWSGTQNTYGCGSARLSFRSLWNSINGKFRRDDKTGIYYSYPFDGKSKSELIKGKQYITIANPWVFAYTFKKI